jgi:RNA polymerase sigma factor (sigma-70 family)
MGPVQSPQPQSRFGGDSDEDLLVYMSLRVEDPSAAEEAWAEFYSRHIGYLFIQCRKACLTVLGDLGVSDLVQETFIRAFEKAATFNSRGSTDRDVIRRQVRAWLGKIANRLFLDTFRGTSVSCDSGMDCPDAQSTAEVKDCEPQPQSHRVKLIREALTTLTERERHILRVTADWYQADRIHQRVSKAEMGILVRQLETTAVNIRQIRKRAIDKVRDYIGSHEPRGK